jgi:hypothetical protein
MHSLFVGPYRQTNTNGLASLSILHHLASKIQPNHSLACRNLYIDSVNVDRTNNLCSKFDQLENSAAMPQTIIQHVPLHSIYVSNRIYNICIPIIDNRGIDIQHITRLATCNKIIADNAYSQEILSKLLPGYQIQHINYDPIVMDCKQKINLGAYLYTKKLYFIGSYLDNIDLLQDLILSFIVSMSGKENISLLLFLTDTNKKDIDNVNGYISLVYKELSVTNVFPKVVCIDTKFDLAHINNCHKIGDIYLNINDGSKNGLHINYARHHNKQIIDWSNLSFEFTNKRNNIINEQGFSVPLQSSIMSAILQLERLSTHSPSDIIPIERAIWE